MSCGLVQQQLTGAWSRWPVHSTQCRHSIASGATHGKRGLKSRSLDRLIGAEDYEHALCALNRQRPCATAQCGDQPCSIVVGPIKHLATTYNDYRSLRIIINRIVVGPSIQQLATSDICRWMFTCVLDMRLCNANIEHSGVKDSRRNHCHLDALVGAKLQRPRHSLIQRPKKSSKPGRRGPITWQ